MDYVIQNDGRYHIPIVALGERLRDNFGLTIREHPHFDPVDGDHADNSYHYYGEAIDVQDWRPDVINGVDWRTRTGNLENMLQGSGVEVLGPNSGFPDHDTHLHLAAEGGIFKLNPKQYDYFFGGNAGGMNATFTAPYIPTAGSSTVEIQPSVNTNASLKPIQKSINEATERALNYKEMSKQQLNNEYDRLRRESPQTAAAEGMKMHRAFFGK